MSQEYRAGVEQSKPGRSRAAAQAGILSLNRAEESGPAPGAALPAPARLGIIDQQPIRYLLMPLRFESFAILWIGLGLALLAALVAVVRRPPLSRISYALIAAGLVPLALAAAGAQWRRGAPQDVAVMVDLSASTRGAEYRSRARLERRIRELLGGTPYRIVLFAEGNRPDSGVGDVLRDIPSDRTTFTPAPAGAILLFSDGRFDMPAAAAPTYPVIDPALEKPPDAAITKLELRGRELVAHVTVMGGSCDLALQGTSTTRPISIDAGSTAIARPLKDGATSAAAQFAPGDSWPENDAASIRVPPAVARERWWVGVSPPPENWRGVDAKSLPLESADYLATAVIVLNNIAARDLSTEQQQRLQQYVRDLGGSLAILGGDHAFAAGNYTGSLIEPLSPLASTPPQPVMQWIVLVDGSGSMTESTDEGTRWQAATSAVVKLLPHLPPEDLATLGSFSENVTWWSVGRSVRETAGLPLPPGDLTPRGPTNLQRALQEVARAGESKLPRQLLLVTDADAKIDDPAALAAEMKTKNIRLHVLAIGNGSGLAALKQAALATGGTLSSAAEAKSWSAGLQELSRAAMPNRVETTSRAVHFLSPLKLPDREARPWNRTWLKSSATPLAEGRADPPQTPVARWKFGTGEVIAAAFAAKPAEATAFADLIAQPPRDPRIKVSWEAASHLRVTIDGADGRKYLNDLPLVLELRGEDLAVASHPIPQTAPGHYELSLPAPRSPVFAAVRHDGRLLEQIAVAGRYPPEFDGIGNDRDAMHDLARRTGGAVIDVRQSTPIDFHWPRRDVPLASWFALVGAFLIAAGLIWWRLN